MDKEWMKLPRSRVAYREGVERFLNFAFHNAASMEKILCPCKKCINSLWKNRSVVRGHLIINGFVRGYEKWTLHGEASSSSTVGNKNGMRDVETADMHGTSRYLASVDDAWNRPGQTQDNCDSESMTDFEIFQQVGQFLGSTKIRNISVKERDMANLCVLLNCKQIKEYLDIWRSSYLMRLGRRRHMMSSWDIDNARKREFLGWFNTLVFDRGADASKEIKALARGPNDVVKRGSEYLINGYRFRTESLNKKRKRESSGVWVTTTTCGYSSSKDVDPREETLELYGVLEDIIELDYYGDGKVVLFKCKWYDTVLRNDRGVNSDAYGFTLVNSKIYAYKDEPFVMPSQVQPLIYVDDQRDKEWCVVKGRRHERTIYGVTPDQAEMWCETHTPMNGRPIDGVTEKNERIRRLQFETSSPGNSTESIGLNGTLAKVLGKDRHGRLAGMRLGEATKMWSPSQSNQLSQQADKEKIARLENTLAEMQQKMAQMEQSLAILMSGGSVNPPSPSFSSQPTDST